jgi:spermidine/putrescine transport system substrate-binding protein
MIRELVRRARASRLTRRSVLTGAGAGAAALLLAACTPTQPTTKLSPAKDRSASVKSLIWANWQAYLDQDDHGGYPTLDAFEKQSGIRVRYEVAVDDNTSYYDQVKSRLALGKSIGADTVCLTDWMVARLIRSGYVQTLDQDVIPNVKNLVSTLRNPDFDPGRKRSLPWQSGFAGLAWNKKKIPGGLKSVSELWDPTLKGKVGVLSEMRDTIGLILMDQGVDISKDFSRDDFNKAMNLLTAKVKSGQIRNIKGNSYTNDLQSGATIAAIAWSGDIASLNLEVGSDDFEFGIPDKGGTLWSDNFVIPMGSSQKTNVEKLINYYYEPEVAATVAAYVSYITPVEGAQEAIVKIDPKLADDQWIFPDAQTLAQTKIFRTLTPAEEKDYQSAFQKVILGS